jgi:lipoyl-dependent peroxiredoxin
MPARGSAVWKGNVPAGMGTFTAGDTISGGYTYKSRFDDGPGSNPDQLIAAAPAACFSMALANILAQAGSPPDSVHTEATVTLSLGGGQPAITKITAPVVLAPTFADGVRMHRLMDDIVLSSGTGRRIDRREGKDAA